MSRSLPTALFSLTVALAGASLNAQLVGPPGGVPVPPAPIASEQPQVQPTVAVQEGDTHFRVRLLDGRTGLPIKESRLRLWYDERNEGGYLLTTDAHGEALLPPPLDEPIRILLVPEALFDCRKLSEREPMPGYNLQQIASRGVLAPNRCETAVRVQPHAGELTIFARPLRWFEQLNR